MNKDFTTTNAWKVIESINWEKLCKQFDDHQKLLKEGEIMLYSLNLSNENIIYTANFVRNKINEIESFIDGFSLGKYGSTYEFLNICFKHSISDDGYWDLCAHIVGLGETIFNNVKKDPMFILKYENEYRENFEYIFSRALCNIEKNNGV